MRDNEYRGRQIFSASFEYRYKLPIQLFFDTYVKLRYDLGSTWEEKEQIRFKDLKHGIGATLSLTRLSVRLIFPSAEAFTLQIHFLKTLLFGDQPYSILQSGTTIEQIQILISKFENR